MKVFLLSHEMIDDFAACLHARFEELGSKRALGAVTFDVHPNYVPQTPVVPELIEQKEIFSRLYAMPRETRLRKTDIADIVGVTLTQMGHYMNGHVRVRLRRLPQIAEAFGVALNHPDIIRLGELYRARWNKCA